MSVLTAMHPAGSKRQIKVIETRKCSALKTQFMIKITTMHQVFLHFFVACEFMFTLCFICHGMFIL